MFSASTLTPVLFIATNGKAYKLKTWRLPLGNPQSRGKAFVNLLPIEPGDALVFRAAATVKRPSEMILTGTLSGAR